MRWWREWRYRIWVRRLRAHRAVVSFYRSILTRRSSALLDAEKALAKAEGMVAYYAPEPAPAKALRRSPKDACPECGEPPERWNWRCATCQKRRRKDVEVSSL